jgi:hypothetical protein
MHPTGGVGMKRKGTKGYAICNNDCDNMYPIGEQNNGVQLCPDCRGVQRDVVRVETDPVADYEAKVFSDE